MDAKTFFGWLLMIVGGLGALFSGGCTVVIFANDVWESMTRTYHHFDIGILALFVGGIPCLIFLAFFRWGRRLTRPAGSLPERAASTSSVWSRLGEELGYAFREARDEFGAIVPGLVRKEGRASSDDDGADKKPKDEGR